MMRRISGFYRTRFTIILFVTIAVLTSLAWHNRFIQDDAFISFRYAYNLVHGKGLVWNEGERVEGYTNFLWTLAMSIPLYLGYDPVTFSFVLGILFFILTLVFTYKLSSLIFSSRDIGLLTVILLGTNYTFSSYATGGLETQMQACIFVTALYVLLRSLQTNDWKLRTLIPYSFLLSAALLTRLDSALLIIVVLPLTVFFILKEKIPLTQKMIRVLALFLPFMVLVGGWFIWKFSYYGDILPNTFYAKAMPSITSPLRGFCYLYLFLLSYLLIPFPLLFIPALKRFLNKSNLKMIILTFSILLWLLYVVEVGGDFMEFRLIVPILPLLFILILWLVFIFIQQKEIQIALVLLVLLGSLHHTFAFGKSINPRIMQTIEQLNGYLTYDKWDKIGMVLGRSFHYDQSVIITVGAAGAIPYYSRLKTIDWFGLSDRWIARYGHFQGYRPGHQRIPSLKYLLERKITLVINPFLKSTVNTSKATYSIHDLRNFFLPRITSQDEIPSATKVVEIPIDQDCTLVVLYLTRNLVVDEAIQRNNWKVHPIARDE